MIPREVCAVLQTLERAGHEAYIVGGCVRDILMGKPPHGLTLNPLGAFYV